MIKNIAQALSPLVSKKDKLIGPFLQGITDGFGDFKAHFGDHFAVAMAKWLGLPDDIFSVSNASGGFDLKTIAGKVLELLGLTWDHVLTLVADALGPAANGIVIRVFTELSSALDSGIDKYLSDKLDQLWQFIGKAADFIQGLPQTLGQHGRGGVAPGGPAENRYGVRPSQLIEIFVPGGGFIELVKKGLRRGPMGDEQGRAGLNRC